MSATTDNDRCVSRLLGSGAQLLDSSSSARLDTELLLAHVLGCDRSALYRDPERRVAAPERRHFERLVRSRQSGRPLAQILGRAEFWSLSLIVNRDVLIPRPETELLVEIALTLAPNDGFARWCDLGTGSGAVALALASERTNAQIVAVDCSAPALAVAARNCRRHDLTNIRLVCASWLQCFSDNQFDLIVSNPPYIESGDQRLVNSSIRFEPSSALAGGTSGLDDLRIIVSQASARLRRGGYLLVEHGYNQGSVVRSLFADNGFQDTNTARDLAGLERVSYGKKTA